MLCCNLQPFFLNSNLLFTVFYQNALDEVLEVSKDTDIRQLIHTLQQQNTLIQVQNSQLRKQNDEKMDTLVKIARRHSYTVSFSAYSTVNREYDTNVPVLFDAVLVNDGGLYSNNTGVFTCITTAYYLFTLHIAADSARVLQLVVGGRSYVATLSDASPGQGSNSMVVRCEAGQQVYVKNADLATTVFGDTVYPYTSFSGVLLFNEDMN